MISRLNHIGLSVLDLDRSVRFYCDTFGMELAGQEEFSGELYDAILGLKGASGRIALIRSNQLALELFEFAHPVPRRSDPSRPVCDHGITHFCIEVADLASEYQRLIVAGVQFHCSPLDFFGAGLATYGRDPDGNVFELLQPA